MAQRLAPCLRVHDAMEACGQVQLPEINTTVVRGRVGTAVSVLRECLLKVALIPSIIHSDMQFELVEPLKELFKDEVRTIGVKLGLPKNMLYRHPFPGPALGVRILGQVKKEYAEILRQADSIFMDELNKQDLYDKVDQAFAVFLPVKSVGVTGDERRYDYVIALRAVETIDFMTARWARLPYDFLDHVSNRIMNEISRVSRVVYDISGKPPSTIEWE
mgnify:CR=1 FL=1